MLFFDLHSDLPTSKLTVMQKRDKLVYNEQKGYVSINAIYKDNRIFNETIKIASFLKSLNINLAFEDCCYESYFVDDGRILNEKIFSLINILCSFNPKYISLGWNNDNLFLGGSAGDSGLTEVGEFTVGLLNQKKICIDCAHSNKKSFYKLAEKANYLICSHTAFEWIFPHRRNIDKEQVKILLQKGGIVGLVGVGHFLTGIKGIKKNYEQAFYEHLQGYLQEFGTQGLCVATDFYGSDATVYSNGNYEFIYRLKNDLVKSGLTENDISKIFYKNAFNYFESMQKV